MKRLLWGLMMAALLAVMGGTGCAHKAAVPAGGDKPAALPVVQTATVRVGEVVRTLRVTGNLAPLPNAEAKITPPFAAKIAHVYVQVNQNVTQGQVIAEMATDTLRGQVQQARATIAASQLQVNQAEIAAIQQQANTRTAIAQAEATVAGARATLSNAAENYARQQQLFQDGLVAKKDVEDARTAMQTAGATVQAQEQAVAAARTGGLTDIAKRQDIAIARQQVQNAYGALSTAQAQMALATIRSPLAGVVATVTANNGEGVDPSAAIATIVDTRSLQLTVAVLSRNLRFVHRGQTVQFTTESLPGKTFGGEISSIGAQVDTVSGTVPVLVGIRNSSHLLRDDMTAVGQIVIARHPQALLIPRGAILTDTATNKASVVVISADGIAHIRPVVIGLPSGGDVEIVSGLGAGEQVATSGHYGLPDGTKVSVQRAS